MTQRTLRSDLAGTVFKIAAAEGDAVAGDQEILVLESMKMEIPVLAPCSGRLVSILVKVGDVVQEGQALAALDPC
jgi:acetyl-CoA carboxylase biotin carboxyl carrier protein